MASLPTGPCPQCEDTDAYRLVRVKESDPRRHSAIRAAADTYAQEKAAADLKAGSGSLNWADLWLHHFNRRYFELLQEGRKKDVDDYSSLCYKKDYGARNTDICSYHQEFRV
jgi:hypothetical protein